jgi:hypothetical protein
MPKPRIRRTSYYATDHRALVLESVATSPIPATVAAIVADCTGADPEFTPKKVKAMIWWLRREGLVGDDDKGTGHFITKAGLDWLAHGRFDRALPTDHIRPGARKPRKS